MSIFIQFSLFLILPYLGWKFIDRRFERKSQQLYFYWISLEEKGYNDLSNSQNLSIYNQKKEISCLNSELQFPRFFGFLSRGGGVYILSFVDEIGAGRSLEDGGD